MNELSGVVSHIDFMLSWSRNLTTDKVINFFSFAIKQYFIIELNVRHDLCLHVEKIFHTLNIHMYRTEKQVKISYYNAQNNKTLTQWVARAMIIQHTSNKAKFIRWVVYTANARRW